MADLKTVLDNGVAHKGPLERVAAEDRLSGKLLHCLIVLGIYKAMSDIHLVLCYKGLVKQKDLGCNWLEYLVTGISSLRFLTVIMCFVLF